MLTETCKTVHGRRGMPEDRARFIAAFLDHGFRDRTVMSVFCHEDRPFPDIYAGGKIENVKVYETGDGDGWRLSFRLNQHICFVSGHVDICISKNMPMLRVDSVAPCGSATRLVFIPEGGYGHIDNHDLWVHARHALEYEEYFEFPRRPPVRLI